MKMQTYVQFFKDDIELSISVTDSLKKQEGNLRLFGHIQITDGKIDDKPIFWDNLSFFLEASKKEFKKECKNQLKEKGYKWKDTYKDIKKLLNHAKKLNLI